MKSTNYDALNFIKILIHPLVTYSVRIFSAISSEMTSLFIPLLESETQFHTHEKQVKLQSFNAVSPLFS